jgi:hypothetical protein
MHYDPSLCEIVLFEVPNSRFARELFAYVAPKHLAWHQDGDDGWVVGVVLNPDVEDLALLLRAVQAWIEERNLAAIRFELDGRTYVLEAAYAARASG